VRIDLSDRLDRNRLNLFDKIETLEQGTQQALVSCSSGAYGDDEGSPAMATTSQFRSGVRDNDILSKFLIISRLQVNKQVRE
jgi:hypothetical protein